MWPSGEHALLGFNTTDTYNNTTRTHAHTLNNAWTCLVARGESWPEGGICSETCKNINRSHIHTPTENNTPDTDTHAHDKNNTPNHTISG